MKDSLSDRTWSVDGLPGVDPEDDTNNESECKKNVELRKKRSFIGFMKRFRESKSKNQVKNSSSHCGGSDTVPNAKINESFPGSFAYKNESLYYVGSRENCSGIMSNFPPSPSILGDTKEIKCKTQEKTSLVDVNIENLAVSNAFSGILGDTKEIKCETQDKASLIDINFENLAVSNAFSAIETGEKAESGQCSVYDEASWESRKARAHADQLGQLGASSRGRPPRKRDSPTNNKECSISSSHEMASEMKKKMAGPLAIDNATKTETKPDYGRYSVHDKAYSVSSSHMPEPLSKFMQFMDQILCKTENHLQTHSTFDWSHDGTENHLLTNSTFETYDSFDEEETVREESTFEDDPLMDVFNLITCGPSNDRIEELHSASFSDNPTFTFSNSASGDAC